MMETFVRLDGNTLIHPETVTGVHEVSLDAGGTVYCMVNVVSGHTYRVQASLDQIISKLGSAGYGMFKWTADDLPTDNTRR